MAVVTSAVKGTSADGGGGGGGRPHIVEIADALCWQRSDIAQLIGAVSLEQSRKGKEKGRDAPCWQH